ncbi:MAG: EAL domain-containing protein [Cryobacterium sp.]|uniref:putative bifunctional diguanylate cyclase/phosphodiesterase n=1 Tax=unclassified Cryobacterium TaxID=2649013 RepID=UPI0018CB9104|nr:MULTISPECIES: EAL domain-containing protein [unclassified Cryobacterium]MCY7403639.1 EAL domain-containing protein [Cryobacterium sp.]
MLAEARETSSATVMLVLRFVRERGGVQAVADVLAAAGITQSVEELEEAMWIGYDTRIRLFEAVTDALGPGTMFKIGESAAADRFHPAIAQLLSAFASPRAVYYQLPRMVPKFSTTSSLALVTIGPTDATLSFHLHDGYAPSRLDCEYAQGLFSAVPRIFGLESAHIVQAECQSDGNPACVYRLTWSRRLHWWSWRSGRRAADRGFAALREQVQRIQLAEADLVSSDDIGEVLARIVGRAAAAVLAPSYLFVVKPTHGGAPLVHFLGLTDERAAELAPRLLEGDSLGSSAVVVDVASTRQVHGRLAALYPRGQRPMDADRALLEAYASHAAAALDLFTALEDSRREESRSTALLALANELATAGSTSGVADIIAAALPTIVECDAAAVLLWDAGLASLQAVACDGFEPDERQVLLATPIPASTTPELIGLLTNHEPVLIRADEASPLLVQLLGATRAPNVVVVPLLDGDLLMGIAAAVWRGHLTPEVHRAALTRMAGVSSQGATALQNARLLATVRHQSLHDSLTGLPNRVLFAERLDQALGENRAHAGTGTVVMFCDLDNFKKVNDDLGHGAGDELLRQVAARLRSEVRPGDTIGRLGGDEFAVLATDVPCQSTALEMAGRIVDSLNVPFHLAGQDLRISTSVGVAIYTGEGGRGERLLASADTAMYEAKRTGRNQIAVSGETASASSQPSLETELSVAIDRNEMRLHFQPVLNISAAGGIRVVGAEGLIRWNHPRLGLLAPAAFLPLAEETGMITKLDLWAMENACAALAGWAQPGDEPLHVAVNLASATLVDPRLLPTVRAALTRNHLSPRRLILEVVESRALIDLPGVVERLTELRQLGIRISLDDFGTGFSTLAWLNSLPVDQIKIDRTFIMDIPARSSVALVQGILALAQKLDIEVVAEGVETVDQLDTLSESGCALVQGYLLGRPAAIFDPAALERSSNRDLVLLAAHDTARGQRALSGRTGSGVHGELDPRNRP